MQKNGNDNEQYKPLLESNMRRLVMENPLDTLASERVYSESMLKEDKGFLSIFGQQLLEGNKLIVSHIIEFTNSYWRMMPSDKATRERCADWINYACNLNPYNPEAPVQAANLLIRLKHKKEAIAHLETAIGKMKYFLEDPALLDEYNSKDFAKKLLALENKLRDVKNDKE